MLIKRCNKIANIMFKNDILTECLLGDAMKLKTICLKIIFRHNVD